MFKLENEFENAVCEMAAICNGLNVLTVSTPRWRQTGTAITTHTPHEQNGHHFADDIFKCIFLNGNI